MDSSTSFGDYFAKLRKSKDLTQVDVADAIHKTPMMVCSVEKGKNTCFSEEDLVVIKEMLKLSEREAEEFDWRVMCATGKLPKQERTIIQNDFGKFQNTRAYIRQLASQEDRAAELKKRQDFYSERITPSGEDKNVQDN